MSSSKSKSTEDINQSFFGEFFNENTVIYLSKSAGSRWFRDLLLMILKDNINPKDVSSVADIGCGIGHKTLTLKKYFQKAKVSGFDFSAPAIKVAKKAYGPKGIKFSCEDITKADYKKRYDLISAFDVLEHVKDWKSLVKRLIKINNRYLLLSFPVGRMRPYEVNIGHFRNFKKEEMEKYLRANGYVKIKTFYAGFPFFSPITRDLTQIFFKNYSETSNSRMSFVSKRIHDVWYILFRYFSMKQKGDVFIGLFEKSNFSNAKPY